jgi:hypothetical protein
MKSETMMDSIKLAKERKEIPMEGKGSSKPGILPSRTTAPSGA